MNPKLFEQIDQEVRQRIDRAEKYSFDGINALDKTPRLYDKAAVCFAAQARELLVVAHYCQRLHDEYPRPDEDGAL